MDFVSTDLQSVIHVIQTSLTPIFLLSAIAGLLGVFTTRLARISDQVMSLTTELKLIEADDPVVHIRLRHLKRRSHALDVAVFLAAVGGAATCATVLTLFLGALQAAVIGRLLFWLFGGAILCTIGALLAFLAELMFAGQGLRAEVDVHHETVAVLGRQST
jgi:MFS family permease